jgi:hypothetical protein
VPFVAWIKRTGNNTQDPLLCQPAASPSAPPLTFLIIFKESLSGTTSYSEE